MFHKSATAATLDVVFVLEHCLITGTVHNPADGWAKTVLTGSGKVMAGITDSFMSLSKLYYVQYFMGTVLCLLIMLLI